MRRGHGARRCRAQAARRAGGNGRGGSGQLVEAAPLGVWPERFGGRTPAEIVALPVADDWRSELHAAWCRAAVRQRDAEWARALLGAPAAPEAGGPGAVSLAERAKLLGTLGSEAERAEWVAGFIAAHGLSEAFQLLGVCAVPWAAPLGGPWSTRSTSRGTRGVTHGASAG